MGTRWLEQFFEPSKIAVIGASERSRSMGGAVIQNLKASGFKGKIYAVNTKRYREVHGVPCISRIGRLPSDVDLAVICTPAYTIEKILKQLGRRGIKAVMVLTGGISRKRATQYRPDKDPLRKLAREYGIRILGPDCLGVLVPDRDLNVSYSHINALPGKVAYIGQSGTLASALLDWAYARGIGFSHFLTIGDSADVSMPDVIDYLSSQRQVKAIMLHLEQVTDAQSFVRSVRNASRGKLILSIKSSRFPQSQVIPDEVPPGLRHRDMVYESIMLRAGVMRVDSTEEMFESVESLTRMKPLRGERLAIVSNGNGGAILAVDRLMHDGGRLAELSDAAIEKLSDVLPDYWGKTNPIDLTPEAGSGVFKKVLEILEDEVNIDAILVLFSPNQVVSSVDVANTVINHAKFHQKNLLTSWMGGESVERARHLFDDAGIPTYDTPDRAIKAFMHMVHHQRNQELLRQTPSSLMTDVSINRLASKAIVDKAFDDGRDYLTAKEIYSILSYYGFNCVETTFVESDEDLQTATVQFPAAIKAIHQDYCHPFAYGDNPRDRWRGVATNLKNFADLQEAADDLKSQLKSRFPSSRRHGYSIQPMRPSGDAGQFSMGITRDSVFGPIILFGGGGATANIMADRHIEFPPLNDVLARQLMQKTHIYRVLCERSLNPERDIEVLSQLLIRLSQLVVDLPTLKGCELNVLLHPIEGALVLGMAADLGKPKELCIRPYPAELAETIALRSGKPVLVRPVRGEDEPALKAFHEKLSPESIRYRFFTARRNFRHRELAMFAQIDYNQEMAFVAVDESLEEPEIIGVVRTWTDADRIQAEFSVIVADELGGEGLGKALMQKMIAYCKSKGTLEMMGTVLSDNRPMLGLAKHLGFEQTRNLSSDVTEIVLPLNKPKEEWQQSRIYKLRDLAH